ncbi:unnamed protein product [Calypogeia fissa]
MMRKDQQGCGMRMTRILFMLSFTLFMLLKNDQCEASIARLQSSYLYSNLYPRTLAACHDKLEEWNNSTMETSKAPPSSSSDGNVSWYDSGAFMRGKWKHGASDSSPVVNPSFVSGDHGKFDFYSPHIRGLAEGKEGPRIQNISGNLYFWTKQDRRQGAIVEVLGVYNNDLGEVCFVGCVQEPFQRYPALPPSTPQGGMQNGTNVTDNYFMPSFEDSDEACIVRGLLSVSHEGGLKRASGILESLIKLSNETGYFTSMSLDCKIVNPRNQRSLYRWDLFIRSTIFAIEAVILMWQVFHSIRSPSSYFVSMLMIWVQIVAMCFLSIYLLYLPLRLLTFQRFKYLLSGVTLVPWLLLTVVILLNVVFLLVILRKRMVAKRLNVVERPQEMLLAIICMIIYAITGVGVWSTHNLETYVQVVWCWFLLPQVIANVFWDLRLKPLHWVYVVGVSLCRITYIGFNAVRPTIYGFDDLNDFPHGWFWGITGTVSVFGSYALLQQYYGGRAFLPQRWFGYKQIPSSKGEANQHEKSLSQDDDTMLDL